MQSSSSSEDDNNGTKNKQIVNKPVPFRPKFVFEKKASSKLKLNIDVDDDEAPVTKKGSIFNHLKTDLSPIKQQDEFNEEFSMAASKFSYFKNNSISPHNKNKEEKNSSRNQSVSSSPYRTKSPEPGLKFGRSQFGQMHNSSRRLEVIQDQVENDSQNNENFDN